MNESDELSEIEKLAQGVADRLMLNLNLNLTPGSPQTRPSANSSIDRITQGTLRVAGVEFTQSISSTARRARAMGRTMACRLLLTRPWRQRSIHPCNRGSWETRSREAGNRPTHAFRWRPRDLPDRPNQIDWGALARCED